MKDEIHSTSINRKRTARAVLTGMCYSAGIEPPRFSWRVFYL
mgnify:CR=1 FL=1